MTALEKRILAKMRNAYDQSINSKAWTTWKKQVKVATDYLAGRQSPNLPDDAEKQYFVINVVKGVITRLAAMLAEGMYRSVVESKDHKETPVTAALKDILEALQERNFFEAQIFDLGKDMLECGFAGIRCSIDTLDDPDLPPITLERMIPGSFMISPFSNKPYDRLLGSPYIIHDYLRSRGDLIAMYPDSKAGINKLKGLRGGGMGEFQYSGVGTDESMLSDDILRAESNVTQPRALDSIDPNSDDLIRFRDFTWSEVKRGNDGVRRKKWYYASFALDPSYGVEGDVHTVILAYGAYKYALPPYVLMTSGMTKDSPYGQPPLCTLLDIQDATNLMLSIILSVMASVAKIGRLIFVDGNVIGPDEREIIESGGSVVTVDVKKGQLQNVGDAFKTANVTIPNFGEFTTMLQSMMMINKDISGVNDAVTGNVPGTSRLSTNSINSLQNATLLAQRRSRINMDFVATEVGRMMLDMVKEHWVMPFSTMDVGGRIGLPVNEMLPPQIAGPILDELMTNGGPEMPNSLRIFPKSEGDEEADMESIPVDYENTEAVEQLIREISADPMLGPEAMSIGVNDITVADVNVKITIEREYKEKQADRMQMLQIAAQLEQSTAVPREIKEQMMWGDEQFYDKEKWDRLRFSDGFMAELAQLVAQIPEEQRQQFNQAIAGAITPFLQAQQPAQQTAPNPSAPAAVAAA